MHQNLLKAEERINFLEQNVDQLEQYGRRSSLRFHRVKIPPTKISEASKNTLQIHKGVHQLDTEQLVVSICNEKMNVSPPITTNDIERSHLIGLVRDGYGQILCKFKHWKTKQRVYKSKSHLKIRSKCL